MTDKRNRILLVEDFEDGRVALSKLLQVEGYTVLEATDGAQAIEIATRERPDLVLMDLSLPVVDGLTATRKIRQTPGLEAIPIIALSGYDPAELGSDAQVSGISDYLTKPVDFDLLLDMLSRFLPRGQS